MSGGVSSEFLRFAVVGLGSTILNYSLFILLLYFAGLDYLLSASVGYFAGVLFGFSLNKKFTFGSNGEKFAELVKYFLVYTFSLFFGLSLLKMLVESFGIVAVAANAMAIAITTVTNFLGSKFLVFRKISLPPVFHSRLFIAVLLVKIIFSFLFGSDFILKGTIPFIDYFVSSGFSNPYQHFFELGELKAFPYSTTMLLAVSFPAFLFSFLPPSIFSNGFLQLFFAKAPLLLADIGIFYILIKLLKTKEHLVLLYYWCSPIILYISYFHGQLDAIPIFLLLLSVYLLLNKKYLPSALVLGIALSAKANIFVAAPFIFLYLWRNRELAGKTISYFAVAIGAYAVLILPFIFSQGYQKLVLGAEEQWLAFLLQIPFGQTGLVIFVVPLVLFLFFLRLAYFRNINQDALMMAFAGVFTILITLVPARPGWFFWVIPFLAYFFVKDDNISKKIYWGINALFLLYFLFLGKDADLPGSLQPLFSGFSTLPNLYSIFEAFGLNAQFISNFALTLLIGIMIVNIYFVYKFGIIANLRYKKSMVAIGISGDSGSGKSYTNSIIADLVGQDNITFLEGDDLHKWERGSKNWQTLTHLNPVGNFLHKDIESIEALEGSKKLMRREYDHSTGKFTKEKYVWPKKFIIASGLHSFYLTKMRQLLDIKIFMDPHPSLRKSWKIQRDVTERGYSASNVIASMKKRGKDAKAFLAPQKRFADIVVSYIPKGNGLMLVLSLDNKFDVSALVEALNVRTEMNAGMDYNSDLRTINITLSGKMASEQAAEIAYLLVPNLEEVLENRSVVWRKDLDGAVQLVILWVISESLKARKGEENAN